jgi:outer membrane protein TolC
MRFVSIPSSLPASRRSGPIRTASAGLIAGILIIAGGAKAQQPLTLDAAVRSALAADPGVQQAEAASLRGRAGRTDAWAALLPRVGVQTGFNRSDILQRTATDPVTGGTIALPDSLIRERQNFGTNAVLSLDWTVFAGGRTLTGAAAARARSRAAEHGVSAARVRAAAEVALVYLEALEAQALVDVRRAQEVHARELERTAEGRYETGTVPEIDVLQARLAASEAQIALMEAEAEARARLLELAERTGIPADGRTLAEPNAPAAPDTAALRARLLAESPLLAAARAEQDAAARDARAARLDLLPTVSVGVDRLWSEYGRTREAYTLQPRNAQTYYRLSVSWSPLERPGAMLGGRQRTTAGLIEARAEASAARRTMEREVAVGLERWARATALRERARLNLQLAERQREQAEERYRVGVAPLSERLNAAVLWAEAARQDVLARHAPLRAVAELERATGVPLRGALP